MSCTSLAYFNSCVNPIIYNRTSKDFRDAFREAVHCFGPIRRRCDRNGGGGGAGGPAATAIGGDGGSQTTAANTAARTLLTATQAVDGRSSTSIAAVGERVPSQPSNQPMTGAMLMQLDNQAVGRTQQQRAATKDDEERRDSEADGNGDDDASDEAQPLQPYKDCVANAASD